MSGVLRHRLPLACMSLYLAGASPAPAQVNIDAYRDYFLVGQFGEVCTMCEIAVLCEAGEAPPDYAAIPEQGSFTLFHIETRTFWSQISTIWEWFVSNFSQDSLASRGHTRPVNVFEIDDGAWGDRQTVEGRLVLDPGVLEFGPYRIDRIDRSWRREGDAGPRGYCQRLPLWESLETMDANAPGEVS